MKSSGIAGLDLKAVADRKIDFDRISGTLGPFVSANEVLAEVLWKRVKLDPSTVLYSCQPPDNACKSQLLSRLHRII